MLDDLYELYLKCIEVGIVPNIRFDQEFITDKDKLGHALLKHCPSEIFRNLQLEFDEHELEGVKCTVLTDGQMYGDCLSCAKLSFTRMIELAEKGEI